MVTTRHSSPFPDGDPSKHRAPRMRGETGTDSSFEQCAYAVAGVAAKLRGFTTLSDDENEPAEIDETTKCRDDEICRV